MHLAIPHTPEMCGKSRTEEMADRSKQEDRGWTAPYTFWGARQNQIAGTSLVVQWLIIRLPMQGTRVRALGQKDPTCHEIGRASCRERV